MHRVLPGFPFKAQEATSPAALLQLAHGDGPQNLQTNTTKAVSLIQNLFSEALAHLPRLGLGEHVSQVVLGWDVGDPTQAGC